MTNLTLVADSAETLPAAFSPPRTVKATFTQTHFVFGEDVVPKRVTVWRRALAAVGAGSVPKAISRAIPYNFIIAVTLTTTPPPNPPSLTAAAAAATVVAAPPVGTPIYLVIHVLDAGAVPFNPTNPSPTTRPTYRVVVAKTEDGARDVCEAFAARGVRVPHLEERGLRKPVMFVKNPYGGVKEAVKIYHDFAVPMMTIAGLPFELMRTDSKGHAEETCRTLDVSRYEAIVTVSGDGVFHEVINGLLTRPNWETARQLPVSTIGAGSSNAMNRNFDCMFPEYGVLNIIKGETRPMDVLSVTHDATSTVHYTHLNVAWAYLADLDLESDRFRWLGREKTTFCAVIRLLFLRRYRAHLHILPIDADPGTPNPTAAAASPPGPPRTLAFVDPQTWPIQVDPSTHPLTSFAAFNLPWIATDYLASRRSRLASGFVDVGVGLRVSRSALLAILATGKVKESDADDKPPAAALNGNQVNFVRARGFRLVPVGGWRFSLRTPPDLKELEEGKVVRRPWWQRWLGWLEGGRVAVSGEPFERSAITVEVHPGAVNVVAPPWLREGENWD
ncbi:hypothetical protein HDU96_003675 [Phlyctochytrium bullatum]|nr:hypothetical protein HDU96_003675 [Phlyctochytrium bullatum]